jgi:hypothetical protein
MAQVIRPCQELASIAYWQMFGSAHPGGMNALFVEGAVRVVAYEIANPIFQLLCRKVDGMPINAGAL